LEVTELALLARAKDLETMHVVCCSSLWRLLDFARRQLCASGNQPLLRGGGLRCEMGDVNPPDGHGDPRRSQDGSLVGSTFGQALSRPSSVLADTASETGVFADEDDGLLGNEFDDRNIYTGPYSRVTEMPPSFDDLDARRR
jgi:hypothetical protein